MRRYAIIWPFKTSSYMSLIRLLKTNYIKHISYVRHHAGRQLTSRSHGTVKYRGPLSLCALT